MSLVEGVAANFVWAGLATAARRLFGRQIQITHPRPLETMTEPEGRGNG